MKNVRVFQFWRNWGLISRLMLAVGIAIVAAGGVQTALLVAEGAAEHSARLAREQKETLAFIAPLVADQALVGEYAAIDQLLKTRSGAAKSTASRGSTRTAGASSPRTCPTSSTRRTGSRAWPRSSTRSRASKSRRAGWDTARSPR